MTGLVGTVLGREWLSKLQNTKSERLKLKNIHGAGCVGPFSWEAEACGSLLGPAHLIYRVNSRLARMTW